MAETRKKRKAKSKTRPGAQAKTNGSAKAKPKSGAKAKKVKKPKAAARAKNDDSSGSLPEEAVERAEEAPVGAGVNAALAGKAALAGTRAAGRAVGAVASKGKTPIVVGGGLVAGAAGGLALMRRRGHHSSTGPLDVDRVISAARRAGSFGEELGRMASLMEEANSGSKRKRK